METRMQELIDKMIKERMSDGTGIWTGEMKRMDFGLEGSARKPLVQKLAELTGEKPIYEAMPTCAYKIGPFELDKNGVLSWPDWADETAWEICKGLEEAGFIPVVNSGPAKEEPEVAAEEETEQPVEEAAEEPAEEKTEETEIPADGETTKEPELQQEEPTGLTISVPDDLTDGQFENLRKLADSKKTLIAHAIGNELSIIRKDSKITFSGFIACDGRHTQAYMLFATKLIGMAKEAKRVNGEDHPVPNEKYAMRCFLLRIGMIGAEYKDARKILLENLEGNSSWRDGKKDATTSAEDQNEESAEVVA